MPNSSCKLKGVSVDSSLLSLTYGKTGSEGTLGRSVANYCNSGHTVQQDEHWRTLGVLDADLTPTAFTPRNISMVLSHAAIHYIILRRSNGLRRVSSLHSALTAFRIRSIPQSRAYKRSFASISYSPIITHHEDLRQLHPYRRRPQRSALCGC